jgi:prepilin-type processing-associated H-X9-DG protein/prepilin-type N-terminal cleavage/methylation domain-containing protein
MSFIILSQPSLRIPALRANAFTLLELLVVMAVLAILISLAVPLVGNGIRSSHTAGCASNMRQIGTGMVAFAAENNGELPSSVASGKSWDLQLAPYLGLDAAKATPSALLRCKEDKRTKIGSTKNGDWRRSYTLSAMGTTDDIGVFGRADKPSRKLVTLPQPQLTVMLAEWFPADNAQFGTNYTCVDGWRNANAKDPSHHGKGANYLFCDGHVELLSPREVATSPKITGWRHGRWGTGIQP